MTFPFLFGVMFGDIGHGSLLMLFGLCLILGNDKIKKVSKDISATRYFVFLMGFFACYCGFLYNDFMSISFNFFDSCYDAKSTALYPGLTSEHIYPYKADNKGVTPTTLDGCVYPFGVDPIWSIAGNNIAFMNSYKMKLAVIFGVL